MGRVSARQRIASCKQELVRSQSIAPVYQQTIRDLDRLKEENQQLRRQIEVLQAQAASQFVAPASLSGKQPQSASAPPRPQVEAGQTPILVQSNPVAAVTNRVVSTTRRAPGRTYTVRQGDTAYSIARSYRVQVNSLLAANPNLDVRRLKVGQTIQIPSP